MKVVPSETQKEAVLGQRHKAEESVDKTFEDVLQKTITNTAANKSQTVPTAPNIDPASLDLNILSPAEKRKIMYRLEGLLNVFEDYQRALGDAGASMRDLHPYISRLEDEKESLLSIMNLLPEGDGLRSLLNQSLIATTVETVTFFRGDYF
jgi:hypothetical protein